MIKELYCLSDCNNKQQPINTHSHSFQTAFMLLQFVRHHDLEDNEPEAPLQDVQDELSASLLADFQLKNPGMVPNPALAAKPIRLTSKHAFPHGHFQRLEPEFVDDSIQIWDDQLGRYKYEYPQRIFDNAAKIFSDLPFTKEDFKDELLLASSDINCRPPKRDKYGCIVPGRTGGREYLDVASTKHT